MDDLVKILEQIHRSAIKGERANSKAMREDRDDSTKRMMLAVRDVSRVLADGSWIRKSTIRKITDYYRVSFDGVCEMCAVAESDDGKWLCIAQGDTPEAPE